MQKKGGIRPNWLKRWFALETSGSSGKVLLVELKYYEKEGGTKKGEIKLDAKTEARVSEASKSFPGEMEIVTAERTYRIRCGGQRAMEIWLEEIDKAVAALKAPADVGKGSKSAAATSAASAKATKKKTKKAAPPRAPAPEPEPEYEESSWQCVPGMTVHVAGKTKHWAVLEVESGRAHIQIEGGKMKKWVAFGDLEPAAAGGASYEELLAKIGLHDGFYGVENSLGLWEESTSTGRDMDGEKLVGQLAEVLAEEGRTFVDTAFPASDASIWNDPAKKGAFLKGDKVQWKRPAEMMDGEHVPVVFSGSTDADDIKQGKLGDCYLLAALAACAHSEWLMADLIVEEFGVGGTDQGLCKSQAIPTTT